MLFGRYLEMSRLSLDMTEREARAVTTGTRSDNTAAGHDYRSIRLYHNQGPHRRRINPRDSRDAGNEIRRGLGPRRNFELQTTPFGTSVFHPQRFTCPDRVRDFSERAPLNSAAPGGWRTSAGLRKRQRLRGTRSIPAQRRNRSAAWTGFAAGEIRSTQTKIGSGRVIRSSTKETAAEISEANRNCHFPERGCNPRYSQHLAAARPRN